jgi:hypothetical protein
VKALVDFVKPRRKMPFKERIHSIGQLLNQNGEVSIKELVIKWGIAPNYAKTLLQWAAEFYSYAKFDGEALYIPERRAELSNVASACLTSEEENVLKAKPSDREPDRAKINWGDNHE